MSGDEAQTIIDQHVAYFNAGEASKFADAYTSDAKVFFPEMPVTTGHEAIVAQVTAMRKAGIVEIDAEAKEIIDSGDVVICRGVYTMYKEGKVKHQSGNLIWILKRVNGELKISLDFGMSDHPPLAK